MPNKEIPGVEVGLYVDIEGTKTLVAARRSLEFEETTEQVDLSHADNMFATRRITGVDATANTITAEGDCVREVTIRPDIAILKNADLAGDYTADAAALSDGDTVITLAEDITGETVEGLVRFVAPYGFMKRAAGQQDWSASLSGLLLLDEATGSFAASHKALRDAKKNEDPITVQVRYPATDGSNPREEGEAIVTSVSLTSPYNEEATVDVELSGADVLAYLT